MATSQMQKNEQGWFCGGCKKQVYDFSKASKHEVNAIIQKSSGEICGLIPEKKLVPVIQVPQYLKGASWLISIIGIFTFLITSCKSRRTTGAIQRCGHHKYYACTHMDTRSMTYAHQPNINDSLFAEKIKNCTDSLNIIKD